MHRQNFHYNTGQQTSEQAMAAMMENDAAALAAEMFDHFSSAVTMRQIMGLFRSMCDTIGLRPGPINEFYPKLKAKIKNWKAQALWKKFDARLAHRVYNKGTACSGTRVLVIGAGPCGLRTAIEAQLLGAKVVVLEKRDRITRNNVLHLWPFLIHDLRALGAKKFYGKFCAGSIDHISIRQLQCLMLKISLLLGIEIHEGVSFEGLVEPSEGLGWRCMTSPSDHPVTHFEFDVLIGADGKRNTLTGFGRKEFRGKLAIAITANFINRRTEEEARIEEISGVAFIFNQSFFKELYHQTGIDLENIVYYKDDTHYFVMTAKKHSLLDKGVILQDFSDPAELLHPNNVNTQKLQDYAREAADFSTKYQMPTFEFAVNHYGKPDVAMFDFTSMFAAENSSRMIVRKNYRLLMCIVGDSLLEPFWPSGSGCARGFLSAMDAAYAVKLFSNSNNSLLSVLSQRESIYRLLAQTTPENLHRDHGGYTLDPMTRYPNLNRQFVLPHQVKHLLDTDDPTLLEQTFMDTNAIQSLPEPPLKTRKRRTADTTPMANVLLAWIRSNLKDQEFISEIVEPSQIFTNGKVLCALIHRYRPDLCDWNEIENALPEESNEIAFQVFEKEFKIPRVMSADESITLQDIDIKTWLHYLEQICEVFRGEIPHVKHPKLDYAEFKQKTQTQKTNNMSDFTKLHRIAAAKREANANAENSAKVPRDKLPISPTREQNIEHRRGRKRRSYEKYGGNIDRERGIQSALPRSGNILDDPFSNRIRNIEEKFTTKNAAATNKKPKDLLRAIGKIESNDWNVKEIEKKMLMSKKITDIGKSREKVPKWNREQFEARQNKMQKPDSQDASEMKYKEIDETIKALDKQLKEGSALDRGERGKNKVASIAASTFGKKKGEENQQPAQKSGLILSSQGVSESCHFCKQRVYLMEKINAEGLVSHRSCLKCHHCHTNLRLGGYAFDRENPDGKFYCTQHFKLPPKDNKFVPKRLQHKQRQADYAAFKAQQQKQRNSEERATGDDLDNRGKTPERIEFENADERSYCEEEADQIMDENEWTDLNFGTGDEDSVDDESSSDESDTESDSDNFEDPVGVDAQTLQLASDWIDKRSTMQDSEDEFYGYSSEDDDADSQTEGEELAKAREMRMNEVKLQPPPTYILTDTETEAQSDTESDEVLNSATEISTDSEFDQDPINHEPPKIFINDSHVRHRHPARVHVKQTRTETMKNAENSRSNGRHDQNVHLKFKPLVEVDPSIIKREPLKNPLPGNYLLSKTASTEGIASKKSLELKKRYLLGGETGSNSVLKSDSASALDIKLKSFASNISECQKLLNPANEISPSMQTFLQRIDRNNELNKSQHSFGISKELKDKYNNNNNNSNNQEEKENCPLDSNKKQEVTIETVNTTLIETKIREMSPEVPKLPEIEIIETIDLTTPEKKQPIVDLDNVEIPQNTIDDNKQFIENMEKSTSIQETTNLKIKNKLDSMFIDLTVDSPPKENHVNGMANKEQNNNISSVPDIISNISTKLNGASKDEESIERPRSPAHETTIEVPQMWTKPVDTAKDIDTDSLSNNSSTSSLEDIPHFILDSTTSPETQNENTNFQNQPPRLEVRDSSGELMQIDSLMIIDGQYIGDPEDLPLFEDQQPTATIPEKTENSSMEGSLSSTKPLKFDTKNENKLESLKHLPLIVAHEDIPNEPHVQLRFSDKISPIQTPDDGDKTPLAGAVPLAHISDSDNEITGQGLTETELSDWAADEAVSENFMDIEFVLNSGKGTIKKNKKTRSLKSESEKLKARSPQKRNKGDSECGILKNLAIEEIDFMDTGSEAESIETHSASNRVVLKNHGYVKFVDHQHNGSINRSAYNAYENDINKQAKEKSPPPVVEAINMEIVNVDFIEQGAYILNNNNDNDSCNINEQKTPVNEDDGGQLLDSLNASCDDIDEDSLIAIDDKNQESLPTTTFTTTETEDLTIVTSPLESLPKHIVEPSTPTNNTTTTNSSTVISSTSTPSDKYEEYERARFERNSAERASSTSRMSREHIEEMGGYEEYVKSLQMKIAQISSGRESLEKKTRRKLSKSDLLGSTELPDDYLSKPQDNNKSIFGTLAQVEAPQTLSKKLEELTKERTKQKDIIHDLVMNKLQAKKQLNAEKRLNRSKNRTNFMSSIQQPNAEQQDTNVITEITPNKEPINNSNSNVINYNERKYHNNEYPAFDSFKSQSAHSSPTKVSKAQSFNYYRQRSIERNVDDVENFRTPAPPPRTRLYSDLMNTAEKMREDARARAKLKSNEDLGLSPEEKILMLRKKYNLMHNDNYNRGHYIPSSALFANGRNQSDDMKYREKKLSVSKSFNDISLINRLSKDYPATTFQKPLTDCMSDPNLADASIKDSTKDVTASTKTTKSQRRDSDRRRSLIQTVSDFFHKKRDQSASNKDLTSTPSTTSKDKLSENSSSTMSVFSRFKLSPKSKESSKDKAKSCCDLRKMGINEKESTPPYTNERSRSVASLKQPVMTAVEIDDQAPPIPPLPKNYQRSDDEDFPDLNETKNELKKLRAMSKASKQAELKRLRIAQEIKREQDEIDLKIKDLETRGVEIEKFLRGEGQNTEQLNESSQSQGASDEELLKELLDIWRSITQLKKRDEELIIRQQELQLEHRHAQLKEELSIRLSCSKLDKSAQDVAAEGAILSEMLEIVSKRAALRPTEYPNSSLNSENISLPVLPPQTTINPLLQHQYSQQPTPANASSNRYQSIASNRSNVVHHTFSSQSHNQEHDVSPHDDENYFLFDNTEHIYLRTNMSLLHDCEVLLETYEEQMKMTAAPQPIQQNWPRFNAHTVLVIIEFLVLYISILYYSLSQINK